MDAQQLTESNAALPVIQPVASPIEERKPVRPPPASSAGTGAANVEAHEFGKGGTKHRYLQKLVKDLAEQLGLRAQIEAPLAIGTGQVDVLIERDGVLAAIEISVSTSAEQEAANIRKCLANNYPRVGVVLAKSKSGTAIFRAALLSAIGASEQHRVTLLLPEELPDFIASLSPPETSETLVKGYRVRTSYNATAPEEAKARKEALARIITRSINDQR